MQYACTCRCLLLCMGVQKMNLWGVLPVNFNHSLLATPFLVLWFAVTVVHRSVIINATQVGVGLGMKLAQSCIPTSWSIHDSGLEMKQNMKVMNINHICFRYLTFKFKSCGDIIFIKYNLQLLLSESLGSNGGGVWCGLLGHADTQLHICRDMALEWSWSVKVRSMTVLKFIFYLVKSLSQTDKRLHE